KKLEIVSESPGGKRETHAVGEGGAQLLFLPRTRLRLELVADQPLASAEAFDKGSPLAEWQRVDDQTYLVEWTMAETLSLEFRLRGQRGGWSSKPYFVTVGLLKDREPRLAIRASGVGRRVTPVARIPLALRVTDDFGVTALGLDLERTELAGDKP